MSDNKNEIPDFLLGGSPSPKPAATAPEPERNVSADDVTVEEETPLADAEANHDTTVEEPSPLATTNAMEDDATIVEGVPPFALDAKPAANAPAKKSTPTSNLDPAISTLLQVGAAEELDQAELDKFDVESAVPESSGKLGGIVFGVAAVLLVGAVIGVATNESMMEQVSCFFSGNIQTCKEEDKLAQEKQWAKEDGLMRNSYGELLGMIYTPPDARVNMTRLQWTETKEEFLNRVDKGGADMRGEPTREDVPNKSHSLKEKERVDSLDFPVLPILEKAEGDDNKLHTYAYEIDITKDMYFERKFLLASKDHFPGDPPSDRAALWFTELGPGQMTIQWNGCDLRPRPELKRPDYVKAIVRENCDMKTADGKKMLKDETVWEDHKRDIHAEFGFRTDAEWMEVETALKANAALWPEIEKEIAEMDCSAVAE